MLHEKRRLQPPPFLDDKTKEACIPVKVLIDTYFNAYNAARLREACQVLSKAIEEDAVIGVSLAGALTPAGLGPLLVGMMQLGFIDYISSTGANLYHDLHFDLGLPLYRGPAEAASGCYDTKLREEGVVRIYDVLFENKTLFKTDEFVQRTLMGSDFFSPDPMGTSKLHHLLGKASHKASHEARSGVNGVLSTAYQLDIPVFCPSPGDSTIGMNLSAIYTATPGDAPRIDSAIDVMEMASIVLAAKRSGRPSAVLIFGGGAPKNFMLQTEPQIQEILGIDEKGHDYFVQVTDARPDTGGLSGATPSEAVSWGKIDPEKLPGCVVCYLDSTVAMPLIASYLMATCAPRQTGGLYRQLPALVGRLREEYKATKQFQKFFGSETDRSKSSPPGTSSPDTKG